MRHRPTTVLRSLRSAGLAADGELLAAVRAGGDEAAFEELVRRHGPLVFRVCRRVLAHHDAEDAFQATFIVLLRRAGQIGKPDSLASWLHGVAVRVSRELLARHRRRQRAETARVAPAAEEPTDTLEAAELAAGLDAEVAGLPAHYRSAVVLCELCGRSRADAGELGVPEGTLSSRLAAARRLLAERLAARGFPAAVAGTALSAEALAVPVPAALAARTVGILTAVAAGGDEAVPAPVGHLATRVVNAMIAKQLNWLVAALVLGAGLVVAAVGAQPNAPPAQPTEAPMFATGQAEPVAADLVRKVRQGQEWIGKAKTFHVRFEGRRLTWDRSPDRKALAGRKELVERAEIAFDADHRMTCRNEWIGLSRDVRVWDGTRATVWSHYHEQGDDLFLLSRRKSDVGDNLFGHSATTWLWNQPHTFWWESPVTDPKRREELRSQPGEPDEFVVTGRALYRDVPCYVLHRKGWGLVRWYVGERTGLLHGISDGVLRGANPTADRLAREFAAARGNVVKTDEELLDWFDALGPEKSAPLAEAYFLLRHPTDQPRRESWLLDYKEVKPGCWFPTVQGWAEYDLRLPNFVPTRIEIRATHVAVDTPVPADLFAHPPLIPGADVHDITSGSWLRYKHDPKRTPEEWEALRAEARKAQEEDAKAKAARDELIGTAAPPLPKDGWLNGPPLNWEGLKGKAVVLVFWAEWCGSCRGCVSMLYKPDERSTVVVIGVHTPGSKPADVERALKAAEADGPVVIDPPSKEEKSWGSLFTHFRLSGLPSAVVIGPDGKLAAHGDPYEMFRKAGELVKVEPKR